MKFLRVFFLLCGLLGQGFALDREAFTFTNYKLDVRVEPEQQRLAVRGKIALRNDSAAAQKNLTLQISSSLDWSSIQLAGKPVQFVSHEYTSDIDHTGELSEAIVTLPQEVPPKGVVELEIGYEGIIPLDATRLTRIGVPEAQARHSDWDRISKSFTAVRGIGYVAWYPIATEAASLSEGSAVEETVGRWKARQGGTAMSLSFESTADAPIFFSGSKDAAAASTEDKTGKAAAFQMLKVGISVPTFVIAHYQALASSDAVTVQYLPGQEEVAQAYGEAAKVDPIIPVGGGPANLQILGLPDPDAAAFVSVGMLVSPLKSPITNEAVMDIVYAKARNSVSSPRAWVQEGLAHYAQAAFIASETNRRAALDYLKAHEPILVEEEKDAKPAAGDKSGTIEATRGLINSPDGLYVQTKAMFVWWMLNEMLGGKLKDVLLTYNSAEDKDPAYVQGLIEKANHRDWQWFFDDWVYRDRGLPDFRIDSVYSRQMPNKGYLVTVTVGNLGNAGAEVPVTVRTESTEITQRLEVRAKTKGSVRIETTSPPLEVVVNDGSVPESGSGNNTFKVNAAAK